LAALIKSSGEPYFVKDSAHRFLMVNEAYSKALGIPPESLVGKTGAEVFSAEQMKRSLAQDDRVLETGQADTSDMEFKRKDSGQSLSITVVKTLFADQAGERFIVGLLRKVAPQKGAEPGAPRRQEEWERTFDAIPDLVAVLSVEHKIVRVNKAMAERLGLPPERCVGMSCHEAVHGLDHPPSACPHSLTCADGKEHSLELHEARLGVDFLMTTTPIFDEQGRLAGAVHVARDISLQKRAERELQDGAKLKSDLVSLINHEYANSLTTMKLALGLLKSSDSRASDESRRRPYEVLDRAIENLRADTTDFLNLHRLESGKFALNLQPTAVRAVVLDVLVTLRPLAEAKKLRLSIKTDFPEELPAAVRADRDCLCHIVSNLITNAVKYTPDGGAVTIRIALEGGGSAGVRLSVEDTGIGMSAVDLEAIKGGFLRAQKSRDIASGFGVGLLVVDQLLKEHGSLLEIESELGKGSRFSFRLPLWQTAAPSRQ
jgi:PAS domain S-box-containing protein